MDSYSPADLVRFRRPLPELPAEPLKPAEPSTEQALASRDDCPLPTLERRRRRGKTAQGAAAWARQTQLTRSLKHRGEEALTAGLRLAAAYTPPAAPHDAVPAAEYARTCAIEHWAAYAECRREHRRSREGWKDRLLLAETAPAATYDEDLVHMYESALARPTAERFAEEHTARPVLLVNTAALAAAVHLVGEVRWVKQETVSWTSRIIGPPPLSFWEDAARATERVRVRTRHRLVSGERRLVGHTGSPTFDAVTGAQVAPASEGKWKLVNARWASMPVYKDARVPRLALAVLIAPGVSWGPTDEDFLHANDRGALGRGHVWYESGGGAALCWRREFGAYHRAAQLFYLDPEDFVSHVDKAPDQSPPPWIDPAASMVALTGLHAPAMTALVRATYDAWWGRGPEHEGGFWPGPAGSLPWCI